MVYLECILAPVNMHEHYYAKQCNMHDLDAYAMTLPLLITRKH